MSDRTNIVPELSVKDLQNPFRLNLVLRLIAEQLVKLQGNAGPQTFSEGPFAFTSKVSFSKGAQISGETRLSGTSDQFGNRKVLSIAELSTYADNAAALVGGLKAGDLYVTAAGVLMRVY